MGQSSPKPFVPITPSGSKGFFGSSRPTTMADGTTPELHNACQLFDKSIRKEKGAKKKTNDSEVCLRAIETNFSQYLSRRTLRSHILDLSEEAFLRVLQSDQLVVIEEYKVILSICSSYSLSMQLGIPAPRTMG